MVVGVGGEEALVVMVHIRVREVIIMAWKSVG